jgi:SAM-dependent methyltransferase
MPIFSRYADYYDLFYSDKDYHAEVQFVDALARKYVPEARTILDLGCGTGRHDLLLSEMGYSVTGVDLSNEMLAVAKNTLQAPSQQYSRLQFHQGDMRTLRLGHLYDVIVALFHIMSYQRTNEDLIASLTTARAHLKPGGVFIFDYWYGPAVLKDPPAIRIKRAENDSVRALRIAEPTLHHETNTVDVEYHILLSSKVGGGLTEIFETHTMRYLFEPEIHLMMEVAGLRHYRSGEWLTLSSPNPENWNAFMCCGSR